MRKVFTISVSTECFADKNSIKWQNVQYRAANVSVDELTELIRAGRCFCHAFNTRSEVFGLREKTDANFREANAVFVDIDDSYISMSEFVGKLSARPTIAYTTPNNYTEKSKYKYRFRLVYLLTEPISNAEHYRHAYDAVMARIANDVEGFVCKDNCGRSPSQQFSGNGTPNCETWVGGTVYSPSDFAGVVQQRELFADRSQSDRQMRTTAQQCINTAIDEVFLSDFNTMQPDKFLKKYRNVYNYFDRTPLEYSGGYAVLPDDYTEIRHQWRIGDVRLKDGRAYKVPKIKRLRDGEGRKRKLYTAALIRKQILPSITFEHLLYNLAYDRYYYYDNSDGDLNNRRLINIARRVVATPLERIRLDRCRPKEFEIDKAYCRAHGITPNQMKNIVRKILADRKIGELYDCSLSVGDNLTMLNDYGVKVGKSRLYEWCKENGIATNPKPLPPQREERKVRILNFVRIPECHCDIYTERPKQIHRRFRDVGIRITPAA